jgi:hypothetical protein
MSVFVSVLHFFCVPCFYVDGCGPSMKFDFASKVMNGFGVDAVAASC